jgi:outer membrane protein TolC
VLQEKLAGAEFRPTVALFASYNTIYGPRTFPNPDNPEFWAMGLSGEWTLFAGGRRLAERRKAQYQLQEAREVEHKARDLITLEVQKAYLEYAEMSQRLPLDEAAVREAQATIDTYNKQYAGNLIPEKDFSKYFENLSTARILLALSEAQYNQHVYAYNVALAQVRLVTADEEWQALPPADKSVPCGVR